MQFNEDGQPQTIRMQRPPFLESDRGCSRGRGSNHGGFRLAPPDFGHPIEMDNHTGRLLDYNNRFPLPPQIRPGEMSLQNFNSSDSESTGVPFEYPPYHGVSLYHQSRFSRYNNRRFSGVRQPRHLYQRRTQQQYGIHSDFYGTSANEIQFVPRDPERYALARFRQRTPYPMMSVRREVQLPYYRNEASEMNLMPPNFGDDFNHFNRVEEYVPEPVTRIRRIRLASLETVEDSNSSNSFIEEENGDESDTFLPLSPNREVDIHKECTTVYLTAVTKYVLIGKQRTDLRAAFGAWFVDESLLNFGGIMPLNRPQCRKSVLIFSGAECVRMLKEKGFTQANIYMEFDYLIKNVTAWLKKSDSEAGFQMSEASNWDEYKYADEIALLCRSFEGMRINWVHLTSKSEDIEKAKRLADATLPKDYEINTSEAAVENNSSA